MVRFKKQQYLLLSVYLNPSPTHHHKTLHSERIDLCQYPCISPNLRRLSLWQISSLQLSTPLNNINNHSTNRSQSKSPASLTSQKRLCNPILVIHHIQARLRVGHRCHKYRNEQFMPNLSNPIHTSKLRFSIPSSTRHRSITTLLQIQPWAASLLPLHQLLCLASNTPTLYR